MNIASYMKSLLLGVLILPLPDSAKWNLEKYSKLAQNEVVFTKSGMEIQVKKSASPIFYSFAGKFKIKSFSVAGEFRGLPHFASVTAQGTKNNDDYPLRIGLIVPGDKTLTGIKKFLAAEWVKRLYNQIPTNLGLDYVHFFNVTQNKEQVGVTRIHPSTDLIKEEFIEFVKEPGTFKFEHRLMQPLNAIGLWLSIDGDDTQSDYTVLLSKLEFEYESL